LGRSDGSSRDVVSDLGIAARKGPGLMNRHCTFCINSLAHWTGLQPYTEEVTARGNLVRLFMLTRV
jgi:hypothetical protein